MDGRTEADRHDEANVVAFRNFASAPIVRRGLSPLPLGKTPTNPDYSLSAP